MRKRLLALSIGLAAAWASLSAEVRTEGAGNDWNLVRKGLGCIGLDGTLRLTIPIGDHALLKEIGSRPHLEAYVDYDCSKRAFTAWRIVGLYTCLTTRGPGKLIWKPLWGGAIEFELPKRPVAVGAGRAWRIRWVRDNQYTITSEGSEETTYKYENGYLSEVCTPRFGTFSVRARSAYIDEIRQCTGDEPGLVVECDYDEFGRAIFCRFRDGKTSRWQWGVRGELEQVTSADGHEYAMRYRNSLISALRRDGVQIDQFTWGENEGFGRGDSKWLSPVHLTSSVGCVYEYHIRSNGFAIGMTPHGRAKVLTIFNPRTMQVRQQAAFGEVTVSLSDGRTASNTTIAR